ncbi:MAG: penicillin-binding protein 1A, partial [Alphaproteobacteria bacterium]|nr:penicillin-binding protein 1A [Alphaproteobacteria bacterium]
PCVTRIYSADGKLIEEYAKEKRIFVPINSVPKSLAQAFIAAEDKNFYSHPGIDIFSIIRAAFANVSHVINGTRFEGGSTITQQVVKNFLLTSERSIERKVKEAILSYMISQVLSKDQILELYLNQLFLGKGYGVAAAALGYFNKSVEELSIAESAFLASLPKAPSQYGSEKNYERALARRNYVIGRMYDDGYITEKEARDSINEPLKLVKQDKVQTLDADYYAEQVRSEVIGMFGEEYFYTAGLTIISCVDSKLQENAANALRFGIKTYDIKRGYRGPLRNIPLTNWQKDLEALPRPVGLRHYKLAVVLNVENSRAKIGLRDGKTAFIKLADMAWTKTNL